MVAAVGTRVTTASTLAALRNAAADARVTSASGLVALNFPTASARTTWLNGITTVKSTIPLRTSYTAVLVAVKGRTANPKLRAWTFSLDGHDFYVLRLGDSLTLVYDLYSEQWMDWDAFSASFWPVNSGINWIGGTALAQSYGSNVLIGDDNYGLLWFLNPDQPYDENPSSTDTDQQIYFQRVIQGQVVQTGREVQPCYAVWLTTDMGAPAYVGAGVKLEISDDAGVTYNDMGTVNVTLGNNVPELAWYSLGQIQAPGRLFRITDDGAVARIDNFEMNDPDDSGKK